VNRDLEIEVKLSVGDPDAVLARLARAAPAALAGFRRVGRLRRVVVLDRYVDTADRALDAAGLRARLRDVGGTVTLTVKGRALERAGVTTRTELEGPATRALDPMAFPPSRARDEVERVSAGRPLVEIARLRQRRAVRHLQRDGTVVELSLDRLEALDGERTVATRTELEAELKAGDPEALAELGAALLRLPSVAPAVASKRSFAIEALAAARRADATRG
jgi:inorganic triphosphatase YgiF